MKIRRTVAVAVLLGCVAASLAVVSADEAQAAAAPPCNTTRKLADPVHLDYATDVPVGIPGGLDCVMNIGSQGWAVVVLQLALKRCNGAAGLVVDGYYGRNTSDVVKFLQGAHGLPTDGAYGPDTRHIIYWEWANRVDIRHCHPMD